MQPVVLVSGASTAVGKRCVDHLLESGYNTFTLSRCGLQTDAQPNQNTQTWIQNKSPHLDQERIAEFVLESIWNEKGSIHAVVNCLGYGLVGPIEETTPREAQALFQANVIDMISICRAVLPLMRLQGQGLIVNISSEKSAVPRGYHGVYSASQAAMKTLTGRLAEEVRSFDVDVALVQTGNTPEGEPASFPVARHARTNSAYGEDFEQQRLHGSKGFGTHGESARSTALLVERLIRNAWAEGKSGDPGEEEKPGAPRSFKQVQAAPASPLQPAERSLGSKPTLSSLTNASSLPAFINFTGIWEEHGKQDVEEAIVSFELFRLQYSEENEPKGWTCTGRLMQGQRGIFMAHRHEGGTCFCAETSQVLAKLISEKSRDYHTGTLYTQREYASQG